jgi:hypothetical protein
LANTRLIEAKGDTLGHLLEALISLLIFAEVVVLLLPRLRGY